MWEAECLAESRWASKDRAGQGQSRHGGSFVPTYLGPILIPSSRVTPCGWSFWHRPCLWPFGCNSALAQATLSREAPWATASPRQVKCRRNPNSYLTRTRS